MSRFFKGNIFTGKILVIAALTLFVCGACLLLAPQGSSAASQAGLFLNPASGTFLVGSTFDVSIVLDTKGIAVNTVEIELSFPADRLQLASPSLGRSIIQLWPAPPVFSNREGRIYFVGGIPAPGIVTSQGVVQTLTFRVVSPGEGEVKFGEKTRVLANDGRGTNILGQRPSAFFRFEVPAPQGPAVSSPTHPDQERWYRDTNPVFVWPKNQFASAFSYSIDRDPAGFPDTAAEGTSPTASYPNLENGIWYFHVREQAGGVWGGVSHFVVKIDNQPPAAFRVTVSPGRRTKERNPVFRFFTTDALSGLSHYEMKIVPLTGGASEALFFEVSPPYQAPNFDPGRYQVVVRANDGAGNAQDEAVAVTIVGALSQFFDPEGIDLLFAFVPWSFATAAIGVLLVAFLVLLTKLWREHKRHLREAVREDLTGAVRWVKRRRPGHPAMLIGLVLGSALLVGTIVRAAPPPAPVLPPSAPTISIAPSRYYPLDEALYLEGRAAPKVSLDIVFEKPGAQPIRVVLAANSSGEWFFAERLELASGEWTVRARVAGDPPSDWSNPRIIQSRVTGVILGGVRVRYLPIAAGLLAAVVASAALLFYAFLRVGRVRRMEREAAASEQLKMLEQELRVKERQAAQTVVEGQFSDLRKSIAEELEHLGEKGTAKGVRADHAQEAHHKELLREVRQAEEAVEKTLKDIS